MSGAALLAGCAILLAAVGLREMLASQPRAAAEVARRVSALRGHGARMVQAATLVDLERRIARAGLAGRVTAFGVLVARGLSAACGASIGVIAAPAAPGRLSWLVIAGLPAAGFLAPDALLERAAHRRRERLVAALPDALDLLAVSAATGRSAAAGLSEVAITGGGPLSVELAITVADISAGTTQERALASLRERVGGSELASLTAAIERSRRFGSPLAEQLRRQATALRVEQRRTVQERAARAAPKIQLVVALVLVPSVMLMIAAGLIANADRLLGGL